MRFGKDWIDVRYTFEYDSSSISVSPIAYWVECLHVAFEMEEELEGGGGKSIFWFGPWSWCGLLVLFKEEKKCIDSGGVD